MPLDKPNLDYRQYNLGEEFEDLLDEGEAPLDAEERDIRSTAARGIFFSLIKGNEEEWLREHPDAQLPEEGELPVWIDTYLALLNDRWPWRKAAFIAWSASPRINRWPRTQEELATQILGLTSDRRLSQWKKEDPAVEVAIGAVQAAGLFQWTGDVLYALGKSASNPDYKHHQDRKLFSEMTGLHVPVSQIKALIASGQFKAKNSVRDLSDEELIRLAGGDLSLLGDLNEEDEEEGVTP